ncbi:unnamed protein product, partial [Symbiodinium necroappetens]
MICLELVVGLIKGCQELEMLQKLHPQNAIQKMSCGTFQVHIFAMFLVQGAIMGYFAFIIWSLIVRIEAGEMGQPSLLRDQELAERAGALGDPWLFVNAPGSDPNSLLRPNVRVQGSRPSPGPRADAGGEL